MKVKSVSEAVSYGLMDPGLYFRSHQLILILSHMRAYTTLLCHLLAGSDEISGHAELHKGYANILHLARARFILRRRGDYRSDSKYLLDKVLHNSLHIAPKLLRKESMHGVVILRQPEDSIRSAQYMHTRYFGRKQSNPNLTRMYIDRVRYLGQLAEQVPNGLLYMDAESIVEDTDLVLDFLRAELGLSKPLSATYRTFSDSGAAGVGDPSPEIGRGSVRPASSDKYRALMIDEELLEEAREVYEHARLRLLNSCRHPYGEAAGVGSDLCSRSAGVF